MPQFSARVPLPFTHDGGGARTIDVMSDAGGHHRILLPWRRVQRWFRHTPTSDIAMTMVAIGVTLVLLAVIIGLVFF